MRTTSLIPFMTGRDLNSDLFGEVDRFFDEAFRWPEWSKVYDERGFNPACDLEEKEDQYVMSVDLPGMKKEDIKIEVIDGMLKVSGERKYEKVSDKEDLQKWHERSYGYFNRSFTLPSSVDASRIEAQYEDGVLQLHLPKNASAKPRQIEIRSGKGGLFTNLLGSNKKDSAETAKEKAS